MTKRKTYSKKSNLVVVRRFIEATRDSGYKNTTSAISELVDNSIQAKASLIEIFIEKNLDSKVFPIKITVQDNGEGMGEDLMQIALSFGGSSRFDDRGGLGRYGMGLPNASISQCRLVELFSWQSKESVYKTSLDVEKVAAGKMSSIPKPVLVKSPRLEFKTKSRSGTLVCWKECDRLENKRISTLVRKISSQLGRMFRHYLWENLIIKINGQSVQPVDPLFLNKQSPYAKAKEFGETQLFEFKKPDKNNHANFRGKVTIKFSELPLIHWSALPNKDKREMGIVNGAGVSVVRGKREIDHGWFFMGQKRKENYDDWWRCEVSFDPSLDEYFGITHTKQQIRPVTELLDALTPYIETTGRVLNSRVRKLFLEIKESELNKKFLNELSNKTKSLPVMKVKSQTQEEKKIVSLLKDRLKRLKHNSYNSNVKYQIISENLLDEPFFIPLQQKDLLTLVLNQNHLFYKDFYGPLKEDSNGELLEILQSLLISAARAEKTTSGKKDSSILLEYRKMWSDTLAVFIKNVNNQANLKF